MPIELGMGSSCLIIDEHVFERLLFEYFPANNTKTRLKQSFYTLACLELNQTRKGFIPDDLLCFSMLKRTLSFKLVFDGISTRDIPTLGQQNSFAVLGWGATEVGRSVESGAIV